MSRGALFVAVVVVVVVVKNLMLSLLFPLFVVVFIFLACQSRVSCNNIQLSSCCRLKH